MAAGATGNHPEEVFRSRAVLVAGVLDFVVGIAVLALGLGLIVGRRDRVALPLGLAVSVVGLILLFTGLGRMTARLEVTPTTLRWTWGFGRRELAFADLEEAHLVEKGSPASGNSWAGFLGGGFVAVFVWWLAELVTAFVSSEPTLGSLDLIVIKRHGAPIEIKSIGAWSTRSSHSQANLALQAVRAAIASSSRRPAPRLPILQYDQWEAQPER